MTVLSIVTPVFAVIFIGYILAAFKKMDLEPLMDILLYIAIPSLVISSLAATKLDLSDIYTVTLGAWFVIIVTGLVCHLYLKVTGQEGMRGIYLTTMFMNGGNMPFPLAIIAFGAMGLKMAVLYYIATSILVYTIGIYIVKGRGWVGEVFRLPLIYASLVGILFGVTGTSLPVPIMTTLEMLGGAAIPLMQLSLGYKLYSTKLSNLGASFAASVIRIGFGILAAYIFVTLFEVEGVMRSIIILTSSMPSAVINFVFAHRYNVQSDLVASTVTLSTFISIFTTPLVLAWIL